MIKISNWSQIIHMSSFLSDYFSHLVYLSKFKVHVLFLSRVHLSLQTETLIIQLKQNVKALSPDDEMATLAEIVGLVQQTVLCCSALENVSAFSMDATEIHRLPS